MDADAYSTHSIIFTVLFHRMQSVLPAPHRSLELIEMAAGGMKVRSRLTS